jgi:hypothetical protein
MRFPLLGGTEGLLGIETNLEDSPAMMSQTIHAATC